MKRILPWCLVFQHPLHGKAASHDWATGFTQMGMASQNAVLLSSQRKKTNNAVNPLHGVATYPHGTKTG
jgi:hypothetical protein